MTPLMSRALLFRLVSVVAGAIGFYLPLAAIPMYAGSTTGAGIANGALLLATVGGELVTPRLLARIGYRAALAGGLVLLGAPALVLLSPLGTSVGVLAAVNAVRGVGFAVAVVAGGALTAELLPAQRRGEGLALVGLVGGVPALVALPFGSWAVVHWGAAPVFVLTAAAPLAALVSIASLPSHCNDAGGGRAVRHGIGAGLRTTALARPAVIFAASASAAGVVVTYLPLASAGWVGPVALLLQPATATASRWWAGRRGDRTGQTTLLVPGVALAAAGMTAMAVTACAPLAVAGAAVFGVGFGVLQNATLSLMYARAPQTQYGTVSAMWNGAYDLGMAAGAITVGALASGTGYSVAFVLVAAAMLPALVLARREARVELPRRSEVDLVPAPVPA